MGTNDDRPAVSDEEWAAFVQRAAAEARTGGGAAQAPQEPSARARMVTERLRREDEERARAARRGLGRFRRRDRAVRHEPEGWRTGPAWQEMQGRRMPRAARGALVVLAVAGTLFYLAGRPELLGGAADRTPLPAETARPSVAPSQGFPDQGTPTDPFRGSPAVQWADGAAGIELPEAKALNGVSQEAVAAQLGRIKEFLVAAHLDPATLRGERPGAALNLLDPLNKELGAQVDKALERPTATDDPLVFFTRFKPSEVRPAGDVVKVRGRMELTPGETQGQVDVVTDYTFVYPVTEPGGTAVERTVVRRRITFTVADPRRWEGTAGKLWMGNTQHEYANSSCDTSDGFLHPRFRRSAAPTSGATPSGPPVDPYDRSRTLDQNGVDGCGTVTRT
ncbi:hypothetical protein [Streptomyces sp. WAC06614]|uniref:hypothetical protein n=1 Tax=Streptomyces sp. WAC06614 TaxID=2487416 RepID=UPI000F796472|nr:hypothetical protein [Streptomyces sp. WAC06614]RSS82575.1 hypothetical protein EF918_06640 [Streptomyces sp. WAC06614]